jgi:hypothetical protein
VSSTIDAQYRGVTISVIRPFQLGDLVLIQRLGRQAARLNIIQSLIQPQSSFWVSLTSLLPWYQAKVTLHILHQEGHGLVGDGFMQSRKRPARPELDIVRLAPGLDSGLGHPAIWEKLLAHQTRNAAEQQIQRIYADVPDQPLPIATLNHAGFRVFARQTIWRLSAYETDDYTSLLSASIRPQTQRDQWALQRLYDHTVPKPVQLAEGAHSSSNGTPSIANWQHVGVCTPYVLEQDQEIIGAIQVVEGRSGVWFQLWADTNNPNPHTVHELLRYGLSLIYRRTIRKPIYIGVNDYQIGLNALLSDYGFVPFTDRAKMVRHVAHWVRDSQLAPVKALKSSPQIAIAPYQSYRVQTGTCYFPAASNDYKHGNPDITSVETSVEQNRPAEHVACEPRSHPARGHRLPLPNLGHAPEAIQTSTRSRAYAATIGQDFYSSIDASLQADAQQA